MMTMLSPWTSLPGNSVSLVLILGFFYLFRYLRSPWRKVPRGPRGLPLLGNIRELANTKWLASLARRNT
ncbi:hypothetical protein BV25DRAFT_1894667 [Artomyces pyxidatus]|uniref:Uncharacterized protein n=1 Tax=Artomyces pyxidatus TaxID=48021 RepID=A0ACB8SJ92_9AGAM|nr:hypothetical protein BV25DRAFT_1894667 [Artomyces pyxidatus]